MADREPPAGGPAAVRSGLVVSVLSIAATLVSSIAAVLLGLRAHSLLLVSFGLTGLLDAAGSFALVSHFRHALQHEVISERHERVALRVVTAGLVSVAGFTVVESARRLWGQQAPRPSSAGLVLAAATGVVLAGLARRKRRLGRLIPSRALLADGWLSTMGAGLAGVTVAGTAATALSGAAWPDPAGALLVALGALAVGLHMARG